MRLLEDKEAEVFHDKVGKKQSHRRGAEHIVGTFTKWGLYSGFEPDFESVECQIVGLVYRVSK